MCLSNVSPKKLHSSKNCIFCIFPPQNYAFHDRNFKVQVTAERKSMSMQMISDEMHSDTKAEKIQFEKW